MVSKEMIDRLKLCFKVIRPRIIFRCVRDQFYFGLPSLFLFVSTYFSFYFIFLLHFSFGFLFYHCCFAFAHLYSFSGVSSTPLEFHFFTFAFQHQTFDRLSLREDFSPPLPSSVEGDHWSGYRRKFIKLKRGDYG